MSLSRNVGNYLNVPYLNVIYLIVSMISTLISMIFEYVIKLDIVCLEQRFFSRVNIGTATVNSAYIVDVIVRP